MRCDRRGSHNRTAIGRCSCHTYPGNQIATPFAGYVAALNAQASTGSASSACQMAGEHDCMIAAITYAVPAAIVSLSVWRAGDYDELSEAMIDEIHTCNNALQTIS